MAEVHPPGPRAEPGRQPPALTALEQLGAGLPRVSPRPEFAACLRARLLSSARWAPGAGPTGPTGPTSPTGPTDPTSPFNCTGPTPTPVPASDDGLGTGTGTAAAALAQLAARLLRRPRSHH